MTKFKQKRIRLDNGKTVIVDVPAKKSNENPFKEVARILSKCKNLKPCD